MAVLIVYIATNNFDYYLSYKQKYPETALTGNSSHAPVEGAVRVLGYLL
jgi:hypothetical protein